MGAGASRRDGTGKGGGAARQKRKRAGDPVAGAAGGESARASGAASPCGSSAPQARASASARCASGTDEPVEEFAPPPLLPGLYQRIEDCDAEALKRILLSRMHRQRPITFRMLEQGFVSCQSDS